MKEIFIEPNDVLIFRDGRAFSAGDDHLASGVFPPSPTSFYGALRSALLSQHGARLDGRSFEVAEKIQAIVGSPDAFGSLMIQHFSLARKRNDGIELLFHLPSDVVVVEGDSKREFKRLYPTSFDSLVNANFPIDALQLLWDKHSETDRLEFERLYVTHQEFQQYLHGKVPEPTLSEEELFKIENRTGIAIETQRKAVETGKLYAVEFVRMNRDVGFAVRLNINSELTDTGLLRLGGEAKSAYYFTSRLPLLSGESIKERVAMQKTFRLVLITPAVFDNGWLPDGLDADGRGKFGNCTVQLTAAAISRYVIVGGWDIIKGKPKQAWRAVPPGSVYFFKLLDGDVNSLFESAFGKSICQTETWKKQGLGITYIGG